MGDDMRYNKAIVLFTGITVVLIIAGFSLLLFSTIKIADYVDKFTIYEQVEAEVIDYVKKDKKTAVIVSYKVNQKSYKLESKVFKRKNIEKGEMVDILYNVDEPSDAIWMPLNENNLINYLLAIASVILIIASIIVGFFDYKLIKNNTKTEYIRQDNGFYYDKILQEEIDKKELKIVGIILMILFVPCIVNAEDTGDYSNYDYVIDKLDVDITVNENNTYNVVEKIDVDYNYQKRSIYRRIPLYNQFPRLDGLVVKKRVQISDLDVNEKYSKTIVNQDLVIKIGDNKKTLESNHYVFKYTYNKGKDELKDKDEFLFNIVGKDWDTVIKKITFKIIMPEDFDKEKVNIFQGTENYLSSDNVYYTIDDNVITGEVLVTNKPAEYVYARIELEDGYFKNAKYKFDYKVIWMFIVPTLYVLVCYLMWHQYGKDDKLTLSSKIKIDNYNSLEAEYLYYGNASLKGISLLLFELARKGKIKIRRIKKNESLINKEEHIIEVVDTNDLNVVEKVFINGLMECRKEHTLNQYKENEIMVNDLSNEFYNTLYIIQDSINNKQNNSWLFLDRTKERLNILGLMIISLMVLVVIPIISFSSLGSACLVVLLLLIYLPFIGVLISKNRIDLIVRIVLLLFLSINLLIMLSLTPLYDAMMYDKAYLGGFIYGMIAETAMLVFFLYMSKRTKEGIDKLGEITSFRKNIMNMEKEEFNKLLQNDKNYYYDILCYINSLNIYEYVKEKIDPNNMECPEWLVNGDDIPKEEIDNYIHNLMNDTYEAMSSVK